VTAPRETPAERRRRIAVARREYATTYGETSAVVSDPNCFTRDMIEFYLPQPYPPDGAGWDLRAAVTSGRRVLWFWQREVRAEKRAAKRGSR
jgi:hypothetical protein